VEFGEICSAFIGMHAACDTYAAYFSTYFLHMQILVMENHNHDH